MFSLSTEQYLEEIQRIVKRIAVIAAQADGAEADGVAERLHRYPRLVLEKNLSLFSAGVPR